MAWFFSFNFRKSWRRRKARLACPFFRGLKEAAEKGQNLAEISEIHTAGAKARIIFHPFRHD
jgi:hypothetical protein